MYGVRSSQSHDSKYVGSERWSSVVRLTRCFALLAALQPIALPDISPKLSNTDLWNALLIYGLNRLWPRGVHKKLGKLLLAMSRSIHAGQAI